MDSRLRGNDGLLCQGPARAGVTFRFWLNQRSAAQAVWIRWQASVRIASDVA